MGVSAGIENPILADIAGGGVSGGISADVAKVVEGGSAFLDRIKELKAAKAEAEKALSELGLGNEVLIAHKAAEEKLAEAAKVVEEAQAQAAQIVEEAGKVADLREADSLLAISKMMAEAEAQKQAYLASAEADIKGRREATGAWVAEQEAKINAALNDSYIVTSQATAQAVANKRAAEELAIAQKAAAEARAKADEAIRIYTDKFNKLNAALNGA